MAENTPMKSQGENAEEALRAAQQRAERAEAELARLKDGKAEAKQAPAQATSHTSDRAAKPAAGQHSGEPSSSGSGAGEDSTTSAPGKSGKHLVEPGSMDRSKQPAAQAPTGHAAGEPQTRGVAALRDDSMMAHLLDSLDAGKDIGHYGRLVFAMIARHFLSDEEVLAELTKDRDFSEEQAHQMLAQVEGRDYSPPRRERILEWQAEQDFPIIPNADDPDAGNVYKSLRFPKETYDHIGHYQGEKA